MVTVPPLVGGENIAAIVKGWPSGSLSFESTSTTTAVSSSVEVASSVAIGASLPEAETKMDIVAVEVSPFPSEIVYSNSSGPEKLGLGLQGELEKFKCVEDQGNREGNKVEKRGEPTSTATKRPLLTCIESSLRCHPQ